MQLNSFFAEAVRTVVANWMAGKTLHQCVEALSDPVQFSEEQLPAVHEQLQANGVSLQQLKDLAWSEPYLHLQDVFPIAGLDDELPETPVAFLPVPDCRATAAARASAVLCLATIESSVVSYASENDGHLFVNLVVLAGQGQMVEKSKDAMRGHTDGVFFPIRGERDETYPNFAPSPDFVCLSGLRNPNATETTVMPLKEVLTGLTDEEIDELCQPQFTISPQKTFREGLALAMNWQSQRPPRIDNRRVLFRRAEGSWIRFSHSSVAAPILTAQGGEEPDIDAANPANSAYQSFIENCRKNESGVVVRPGDILLVNNRIGLHGRSEVGGEAGGTSRWLLRTYGLETGDLAAEQRYQGSSYKLYP
ncbi:TauD/TfdA family dioxygenase [Azotobacter beijerinckii]|nr:TauD/TfdA family dioxygenase [Azotobacter beijerinckii]